MQTRRSTTRRVQPADLDRLWRNQEVVARGVKVEAYYPMDSREPFAVTVSTMRKRGDGMETVELLTMSPEDMDDVTAYWQRLRKNAAHN